MSNLRNSKQFSLSADILQRIETERCRRSPERFIDGHCQVEDKAQGVWLPFNLWDAQRDTLSTIINNRHTVALKARQLGFTWLVLAYALWLLVFQRATVLLFSQRDDDAQELMRRLIAMHSRLPAWARQDVEAESKHELKLANGAQALAFPTTARSGRSYTASFVLVDEADFIQDLQGLLNAVKPTVDAGGKLVLLSTSDKSRPESPFKKIYLAARAGENGYAPVFHGWDTRPGRTLEWYEAQKRDILANTGALDDLHQEYPATDAEALAPRSLDKRIPPDWLMKCYVAAPPADIPPHQLPRPPAINGLVVYRMALAGKRFVAGADPAEGNPTSDDSAAVWLDAETGEEVASLVGRFEPSTFASHLDDLCKYFNSCPVLIERNNHGHAVILSCKATKLPGSDGKAGWLTVEKSKALMYSMAADVFRDGETIIHSLPTYYQLTSIEGATLRAPEGQHDDRAIAYALALVALVKSWRRGEAFTPTVRGWKL